MSEQEIRNKIEFIVEQQAAFSTDLLKLQEEQAKSEARISRLEGAIVTVVNMIGQLTKSQSEQAESQKATNAQLGVVVEKVDALTERLDAIIDLIVKQTLGENGETRTDGTN